MSIKKDKYRVGVIGGAGYTAGELLRLLVHHPAVEIAIVHSRSQAGKPLHSIHKDLLGESALLFSESVEACDIWFLCMGHGQSRGWLEEHPAPEGTQVIDLSTDYRHKPENGDFVYGLPELNREAIKGATHVANPGCFATAIQLALLPLADAGLLKDEVHIHAITGSTGAGQSPGATTHFSWRSSNVSHYKAFEHQHLLEIGQSLEQAQGAEIPALNFVPVRGNFTRGIFATAYTECALDQKEAQSLYHDYYADHVFTHVCEKAPALKEVVNTNKCFLSVEKHGSKLLITSVIDNLLKGASGQAVQNMNLLLGLPEYSGLQLKASYF